MAHSKHIHNTVAYTVPQLYNMGNGTWKHRTLAYKMAATVQLQHTATHNTVAYTVAYTVAATTHNTMAYTVAVTV